MIDVALWSVEEMLRRAGEFSMPVVERSAPEVDLELFDSIYRGYPIGVVVLWDAHERRRCIYGERRLASLLAILSAPDSLDAGPALCFDLQERRFLHAGKERPSTWLPLADVGDTMRFLRWMQGRDLPVKLLRTANDLVRGLREYQMPVYVIRTEDERQIGEMLDRMTATEAGLSRRRCQRGSMTR